MENKKKYYAVVINEKENGDHHLKRFTDETEADKVAKEKNGKVFEYEDKPLGRGDAPWGRGKLIANYTSQISSNPNDEKTQDN